MIPCRTMYRKYTMLNRTRALRVKFKFHAHSVHLVSKYYLSLRIVSTTCIATPPNCRRSKCNRKRRLAKIINCNSRAIAHSAKGRRFADSTEKLPLDIYFVVHRRQQLNSRRSCGAHCDLSLNSLVGWFVSWTLLLFYSCPLSDSGKKTQQSAATKMGHIAFHERPG